MLGEGVCVEPDLSTACMTVFENFGLVFDGDFIPPANMFKVTGLFGLRAFLIVETEERTILLGEVRGEQLSNWGSLLAAKKTGLRKIFSACARFEFWLLRVSVASRSTWWGCIHLDFFGGGAVVDGRSHDSTRGFMIGVAISWGERWYSIWVTPFEDVVFHSFEEAGNELCDLQKFSSTDAGAIISMLNQVDVHGVCGVNCQLR